MERLPGVEDVHDIPVPGLDFDPDLDLFDGEAEATACVKARPEAPPSECCQTLVEAAHEGGLLSMADHAARPAALTPRFLLSCKAPAYAASQVELIVNYRKALAEKAKCEELRAEEATVEEFAKFVAHLDRRQVQVTAFSNARMCELCDEWVTSGKRLGRMTFCGHCEACARDEVERRRSPT